MLAAIVNGEVDEATLVDLAKVASLSSWNEIGSNTLIALADKSTLPESILSAFG